MMDLPAWLFCIAATLVSAWIGWYCAHYKKGDDEASAKGAVILSLAAVFMGFPIVIGLFAAGSLNPLGFVIAPFVFIVSLMIKPPSLGVVLAIAVIPCAVAYHWVKRGIGQELDGDQTGQGGST